METRKVLNTDKVNMELFVPINKQDIFGGKKAFDEKTPCQLLIVVVDLLVFRVVSA